MNLFRTGLLLAAMTGLFLAVGFLLAGEGGLVIAFLLALGMNAFAFWNSADMVLRMHKAREVDRRSAPEFYGLIENLARRAELPMPRVYIIETDQPNAFATGRSPNHAAVAATRGILKALSREELAGVMAHELAHIKNRDTLTMTIAATLAGAIGFLSQFAFFFMGGRGRVHPLVAILVMILAPIAAMLVQMAISRTREYAADRMGAEICGQPRWLASALQKIERFAKGHPIETAESNPATAHMFIINPLSASGLNALFRTHPKTDDRVRALLELEGPGSEPPPGAARPRPGPSRSSAPRRAGGSVPSSGPHGRPRPWN